MSKPRPGRTVKVSVSLDRDDVTALKHLAKTAYAGNLSAAFAEASRLIRQRAARRQLIERWGGPSLTPAAAAAIDAEQSTDQRRVRSRKRRPAA